MKKTLKINTRVIKALNPCKDRFKNWRKHYDSFNRDILEFLCLENITSADKVWVAIRVLPRNIVEIFAINCAFSTAAYVEDASISAAVNASVSTALTLAFASASAVLDASIYAALAAVDYAVVANASSVDTAFAATTAEKEYQVDALIWLIKEERAMKKG